MCRKCAMVCRVGCKCRVEIESTRDQSAVCDISGGSIDNVLRKSCRSTGISKAVDRLVYRKSYKVKEFITFGLCVSWLWL